MSAHEHPVWELLDRAQMDIRNAQARLVELRSLVAQTQLAPPRTPKPACSDCGVAEPMHAADCPTLEAT